MLLEDGSVAVTGVQGARRPTELHTQTSPETRDLQPSSLESRVQTFATTGAALGLGAMAGSKDCPGKQEQGAGQGVASIPEKPSRLSPRGRLRAPFLPGFLRDPGCRPRGWSCSPPHCLLSLKITSAGQRPLTRRHLQCRSVGPFPGLRTLGRKEKHLSSALLDPRPGPTRTGRPSHRCRVGEVSPGPISVWPHLGPGWQRWLLRRSCSPPGRQLVPVPHPSTLGAQDANAVQPGEK